MLKSSRKQLARRSSPHIEVLVREAKAQERVVEKEEAKELIFHDVWVAQKCEVLDALPVADKTVIAANIRTKNGKVESRRVGEVQVVLCFFTLAPQLHLFDLRDVHHCLEHYFVEEEGVDFEVVEVALLVAVQGDVAQDFDGLVYLLHFA